MESRFEVLFYLVFILSICGYVITCWVLAIDPSHVHTLWPVNNLILQVDYKSSGKTALQVASHQGHKDIVQFLLMSTAKLELQDEDGDSALHYSAFGYVS